MAREAVKNRVTLEPNVKSRSAMRMTRYIFVLILFALAIAVATMGQSSAANLASAIL